MPRKNGYDWFTQATLNAQMAEAPAIMQASGWDNSPETGIVIGDPNAEGAVMLADALKQIGIQGAGSLLGDALGNAMIYGWNKVFNGATPKQVINLLKTRRKYKDIVPNYTPGDKISHLITDWTPEKLEANFSLGKYHISQSNTMASPEIIKMSSPEKAREAVVDLQRNIEAQKTIRPMTLSQKKQAYASLKKEIEQSGKRTSLVRDGDLSTDSYKPLYDHILLQNARAGKGTVVPVMDGGRVRMMRLNNMGVHNTSGATVKSAVKDLNKTFSQYGLPQVPEPITIGPVKLPFGLRLGEYRYAPAVQYLHFKNGGLLRTYPKHR